MLQVEPAIIERLTHEPRVRVAEGIERILRRARALPDADRLLVELALGNRMSRRQIGILLGISTGSVCRRLQKLTRLLHDPLVIALLEHGKALPEECRELAIERFVRRRSLRSLAQCRGIPLSRAISILNYVRGWADSLAARR